MRISINAIEPFNQLLSTALRLAATEYTGHADAHYDDGRDLLEDELALAARDLVAAIDASPPECHPVGWRKDR